MTHTQNSLSFEQALMDGVLCIQQGCRNVLVGAADEMENALYNMHARLNNPNLHAACGASFFMLSTDTPDTLSNHLVDVRSYGLVDDLPKIVNEFLNSNDLSADDIDVVLYSCNYQNTIGEWGEIFYPGKLFDYALLSGCYFTNSAFAMNYGMDLLSCTKHPFLGENIRRVLICNNSIPENLGLILLSTNQVSHEAHQ
jgi:hypothetical protein